MRNFPRFIYLFFSLYFLFYLFLPNPDFPSSLPESLQSNEPADTETFFRRAYYTNFSREEVLSFYQKQFNKSILFRIPAPTYRLNYPPEEAQTLIRDQTRSTFLEEIVHPFRESIYVSGFEPKLDKDAIRIGDKVWKQKVIVRYVPSNLGMRVFLGVMTLLILYVILKHLGFVIPNYQKGNILRRDGRDKNV